MHVPLWACGFESHAFRFLQQQSGSMVKRRSSLASNKEFRVRFLVGLLEENEMNSTPNVIDSFSGEYRFLSNFYPSTIFVDGFRYPTVEHAFQAAKTADNAAKQKIATTQSALRAKSLGRQVRLRKDWEAIKVAVMRQCVALKFESHPDLAEMLLDTGDARLIEGNSWNDTYWGVCGSRGKNHLGKILMGVRTQLLVTNRETTGSIG